MKASFFYVFFLLLMVVSTALAQGASNDKKESDEYKKSVILKAYRSNMKNKNYAGARKELDGAMKKYQEAANDAHLYKYKVDALTQLIVAENRKIYLNSRPDTVSYFNYVYELYVTGLLCDSLEQNAMEEKRSLGKKAKPKLRNEVRVSMLSYRKNVLNAGKYYYKKKDYPNAYKFFDMYARTKNSEIFIDKDGTSLITDPDDMKEVASLAVLSAYASSNYQGVTTYLDESLKVDGLKPQMLELGSKSAAELGDTVRMLELLESGFHAYPDIEYFFMTLIKFYNDSGEYDKALQKVQAMIELYPEKRDYWYMAGKEQMLLEMYNEALVSFERCVEIEADDAEAYSSIGNIYLHDAQEMYARFDVPITDPAYSERKELIDALYEKACRAFEHAKLFDENNKELWISGLRETYFKLNRGKELRSLEKYK